MKKNISNDTAKELIIILAYCDTSFLNKIPDNVLKELNDLAADSDKEYHIDKTKTLIEQNLSDECKNILSELYFKYALNPTSKQIVLDEILNSIDKL